MFETILATVTGSRRDSATQLAASAAYFALFSLVPLLLFLTSLSAYVTGWLGVEDAVPRITVWVFEHLGSDVANVIEAPIEAILANRSRGTLSLGAALTLWSAKTGVGSLMHAVNVAYGVDETRGWVHRNLLQLALTLSLGVVVIAASTLLLVGSSWGARVAARFDREEQFQVFSSWGRWPIIVALLVFGLNAFYRIGPNITPRLLEPLPGAVLAVCLWGVVTFGFTLYLEYVASWADAYGAISGILAFIFWLWAICLMMIVGGELNATLIARRELREAARGSRVPDS